MQALLAFLTANRYSLIFTLKVTIVKRIYPNDPIRRRAMRDLYTVLIAAPIFITITLLVQECSPTNPEPTQQTEQTEPQPKPNESKQ